MNADKPFPALSIGHETLSRVWGYPRLSAFICGSKAFCSHHS